MKVIGTNFSEVSTQCKGKVERWHKGSLLFFLCIPLPFDPPFVPRQNPCGVYQRTFAWTQGQERCYLNFDGVDSCLSLIHIYCRGGRAGSVPVGA